MITFQVGEKFPFQNRVTPSGGAVAMLEEGFFSVVCSMPNLQPDEIEAFGSGVLKYGIFSKEGIPFFLLLFPGFFSFDPSINIKKMIDQEAREMWLNADANGIVLYLVESKTGILKIMRLIGIKESVAKEIKRILRIQDKRFKTALMVDNFLSQIMGRYSTADMVKRAKMYELG